MGIRWGFGKSFAVSPKRWVLQNETELLQQTVRFCRLKKKKGSFFQSITSLQKNSAKVRVE